MPRPSTNAHWLADVAAHAGLKLELPKEPNISELTKAWGVVAKACNVNDEQFAERVARHFRLGVSDLSTWDSQAVALLPEKVARAHGILPLNASEATVVVATSDPPKRAAREDIVAHSARQPVFLVASPSAIAGALDRAYAPARSKGSALQTLIAEAASEDVNVFSDMREGEILGLELESPAVVKLTDVILKQAVRYDATEIHLEPGPKTAHVRYRMDGVLQKYAELPPQAHYRVVARLKNMGRRPSGGREDARGAFTLPGRTGTDLQAQLHSAATPDGEHMTVRITDPSERFTLEGQGYDGPEGERVRDLLQARDGLVLVTGPAGSGKTLLIYAALTSRSGLKVVSLENPVELLLPGVTQIQYDPASDGPYDRALQQLLSQDPDLLHAGEIRDLATARIVLRAAVTGRRVIATLHTSDAISGVRRLVDMGLAPGRLGESLRGVVSVRLIRQFCAACSEGVTGPEKLSSRERHLAEAVGKLPARRAVGCGTCGGTGYRGQLPLAEVLTATPALLAAIAEGAMGKELDNAARANGMRTFLEVAMDRVARGQTSLQEVERVLGLLPERAASAASVGPILVVDDEADIRFLLRTVLEKVGFEVVEANDGPPAIALIRGGKHDFSMVLLDLLMPQMHGLEVLKRIRGSLATQALSVVVLTASTNPRDEVELLEAGADDFLVKPIDQQRLEARVRAVMRRSGVRLSEFVAVDGSLG